VDELARGSQCPFDMISRIGIVAMATMMAACSGTAPNEEEGSTSAAIVRNEILTRARSWLDERVPYSQSRTHTNQFGTYRTDCSGYVSMAWALSSSYTTWTLWNVSSTISAGDLQPGDALLKDSGGTDHVALFVRWAGPNRPVVWEEYTDGRPAEERTWESLRGFTPVRYKGSEGTASGGGGGGGGGLSVLVTWNGVPNHEASLDLVLTKGRTIAPCIAVDVLRDEFRRRGSDGLGYRFTGECVSPHIRPSPDEIVGFQVCTAANDDWAHARCTRSAPWDHTNKTVHVDNH
jgi:hypothetical protein